MPIDRSLLNVFSHMAVAINNPRLSFSRKLDLILNEIADIMQVKKASIMLRSGRSSLRVVSSTNPDIVGVIQKLSENTPSSWVVRNKRPLYIDPDSPSEVTIGRYSHYQGEAFYIVPIINNGRVVGVISVTDRIGNDRFSPEERDLLLQMASYIITAIQSNRLASSLAKSHAELRKQNKELERLEKVRTELFNMLIHDLKGPLSEIVANLDILSYTVNDDALSYVETAKTACDTLQRMISNLLDIARLEEGKLQPVLEQIDPVGLVREARARLLVSLKLKDITISESYPDRPLPVIEADRDLLLRVLQNLISNAIQYSPHGGIIQIGCRQTDDAYVEFFVKDSGPGIPEQFREAIFEKYTRLHAPSDGRIYSAGLGLAFCKMAISAHGGSIGVNSDGQCGSTFFFTVPVKIPQDQRNVCDISSRM